MTGDGFTDILVQTNPKSKTEISKIKVKYTETSEYVSPGCGIRKLYNDLTVSPVEGLNPVKVLILTLIKFRMKLRLFYTLIFSLLLP